MSSSDKIDLAEIKQQARDRVEAAKAEYGEDWQRKYLHDMKLDVKQHLIVKRSNQRKEAAALHDKMEGMLTVPREESIYTSAENLVKYLRDNGQDTSEAEKLLTREVLPMNHE